MVALGALYIRPKKTKEKLVVQKIKAIKNTRYKVRPKKNLKNIARPKKIQFKLQQQLVVQKIQLFQTLDKLEPSFVS